MRNVLDLVILKTVERGPIYGYDIIAHIHSTFNVMLSPGTVYPLLNALEREGILESTLKGKRKKFYTLTREGRAIVEAVSSEYMKVHRTLGLNTT